MPPALFHIARAILAALAGALANVAIIEVSIIKDSAASSRMKFWKMKYAPRHSRAGGNPVGLHKMHFCLAGFPPHAFAGAGSARE